MNSGTLTSLNLFVCAFVFLILNTNLGNEDSLLRIPGQIIQAGAVVAGQRLRSSLELVVGVIVPGSRRDIIIKGVQSNILL